MDNFEAPRRGRPPKTRAEEVRQERRRNPSAVMHTGIKLGVDESQLDRDTFEYRWVNDKGGRVQQLYNADWDPVSDPVKEDTNAVGSVQTAIAGKGDNGAPFNAVLMRKRKDWFEEDKKAKSAVIDAMDADIRRGVIHEKSEPALRDGTYTPGGRNEINR